MGRLGSCSRMEWSRHATRPAWGLVGVMGRSFGRAVWAVSLPTSRVLAFSAWSGDPVRHLGLAAFHSCCRSSWVAIGLWIRLGILEDAGCSNSWWNTRRIEKAPILEVIKKAARREIILSALLRMAEQAPFYIFTAFIFAYAVQTLHMSRDLILAAVMAAACVSFVTIPLSGPHLRSTSGRRKMYLIGAATTGPVRVPLLRQWSTPALPYAVFIAIVLSLIPARHAVRPAGRADRRGLHGRACATAAPRSATSSPRSSPAGPSAADRGPGCSPNIIRGYADLDLHRRLRGGQPGGGGKH